MDKAQLLDFPRKIIWLEKHTFEESCLAIEQAWIEVQNGLYAKRLDFKHSSWSVDQIHRYVKRCQDELIVNSFDWNVRSFVLVKDEQVILLAFSKNLKPKKVASSHDISSFSKLCTLDQAKLLVQLSTRFQTSNKLLFFLKKVANGTNVTTSTLAAELLTANGHITIPRFIQTPSTSLVAETRRSWRNDVPMFEDRIDVHSYNFFEVVHPAYANQCIEMAHFIRGIHGNKTVHCIDVGSGPGTALTMLLEMLPNLRVHAVEPSDLAFAYLKENLKGYPQVKMEKTGFLELVPSNRVPLVVSTGASHHFNTYFFFQKAWDVLCDGGDFLVADEYISPFETEHERARNLILHHTAYMLATLFEISLDEKETLLTDEVLLTEWFQYQIPMAAYLAFSNKVEQATQVCRDLLRKCRNLSLPHHITAPLMAFYRLQLLELEALVAGLDYEVEQKTYPERFCEMAETTGFSLVAHSRIYPTVGGRNMDGGTHLFAFRKEGHP